MFTLRQASAILICFSLGMGMVGCATTNTYRGPYSPEKLGKIGAKINKTPSKLKSLLDKYSLTRKEFERAIREISSRPDLSERYRKAFKRSNSNSE